MRPHHLAIALALGLPTLPAAAADLPLPGMELPVARSGKGFGGAWYLRGDIGYSMPADARMQVLRTLINGVEDYSTTDIARHGTLGAGVGFHLTRWLRVDATLEHRFASRVKGAYSAIGDPTIAREDTTAKFSALTGLFNAYVDLGAWSGITPYVGAGAGVAQLKFSDYAGTVTVTPAAPFWGTGICPAVPAGQNETCASNSTPGAVKKTGFAWAVMAGAGVDLKPGLKLDFGYRYMNYGTVAMRPDPFGIAIRLKDVKAHEVRFGLRYFFDAGDFAPDVVTARN
jgi:opacity protein-like surface antigen